MAKKSFSKTAPRAQNDNILPIAAGDLVYLTGIPEGSPYSALEGKLLLSVQASKGTVDEEDFYLFRAINVPERIKFGQLLKNEGYEASAVTTFLPLWQGGIGAFGIDDNILIAFVLRDDAALPSLPGGKTFRFGAFTGVNVEKPAEAEALAKWCKATRSKPHFLLICGETMLEAKHLNELTSMKALHIAKGAPAAVFHPEAEMRARIAFPYLFGEKPGPTPAP